MGHSSIDVDFGGDRVRESDDSVVDWEKSARYFLRLHDVNDTSLGCPTWNAVFREPNELEVSRFRGNSCRSSRDVRKPAGNSGACHIEIGRSVFERILRVYWMYKTLSYRRSVVHGCFISLFVASSIGKRVIPVSFPVHVQQTNPMVAVEKTILHTDGYGYRVYS